MSDDYIRAGLIRIKLPQVKFAPGGALARRGIRHRLKGTDGKYSPFVTGNKLAAAENLAPDAHARRMSGLYKAWQTKARKARGERVVTAKTRKKIGRVKRAKLHEAVALEAREMQNISRKAAPDALRSLHDIILSSTATDVAKISAASVLLDRAYGKASQTNINANLDVDGKPANVTEKELTQRIEEALARVNKLTAGAAEPGPGTKKPAPSEERPKNLRRLN